MVAGQVPRYEPSSIAEASEIVREASRVFFEGGGAYRAFSQNCSAGGEDSVVLSTKALSGIVDFSPADQVAKIRAGSVLSEVQSELLSAGQCLPLPIGLGPMLSHDDATIGAAVSMNLPHPLEARRGSWRDWVLGMTVVLADGTAAKSGSSVVKSVAGYDVHKLFIGARGTLGMIAELTVRTCPAEARGEPSVIWGSAELHEASQWVIQRTMPVDFDPAMAAFGASLWAADRESSTLWAADREPMRFAGDWVLRSGRPPAVESEAVLALMRRTKLIFDERGKLNPGAMGVF